MCHFKENIQPLVSQMETLEEFDNEDTPPPSPPSPPSPPPSPPSPPGPPASPSPLWNQQDFNFYTHLLQNQLTELENIVIGPHIIVIDGIQHLRSYTGQNWKDRLNLLLFEARIPFFWIIDIIPDDDDDGEGEHDVQHEDDEEFENEQPPHGSRNNENPHRVRMYLINHHVKTRIFSILNTYLNHEYNNIVYLE